jgi:hypothetical protein
MSCGATVLHHAFEIVMKGIEKKKQKLIKFLACVTTSNNVSESSLYSRSVLSGTLLSTVMD